MLGIVLSRFYLQGKNRQIIMVIYQKIHLALFLIVVIIKFETMCGKFLCNNTFIHRAEIDALDVLQYNIHV